MLLPPGHSFQPLRLEGIGIFFSIDEAMSTEHRELPPDRERLGEQGIEDVRRVILGAIRLQDSGVAAAGSANS